MQSRSDKMFIGLFFALLVAVLWSLGEISYSRLARNLDRANVYFYQYLTRAILYLTVVVIFNISLFTDFSFEHFLLKKGNLLLL